MSVQDIYDKAKRERKCRVCGKKVKEKGMRRGRCRDCDYKNLKPIE